MTKYITINSMTFCITQDESDFYTITDVSRRTFYGVRHGLARAVEYCEEIAKQKEEKK